MGALDVLATIAGIAVIGIILLPFLPRSNVPGTAFLLVLALGLSIYALAQISELNDQLRVLREELEKVKGDESGGPEP
ncbi:hypothetical protein A3L11_10360 [Thermococcus siculi]|uniref:Uncharacterized protein n=1 Tax=Thermococcus siculi TaxID=72803 RepID=A0A2Z2MMK1_9EURY|nr:hypothetical protein [Thermococcus siculi]ASJ09612.1 hypothetical protein A3L11_10360 [Thermococcus siculi]